MPKGEIVFKNRDAYHGELKQGQPHGQGTYKFAQGAQYTGQFQQGHFEGSGHLLDPFTNITIKGNFSQGLPQGHCQLQYPDGCSYEGQMQAGFRHGRGTLTFGPDSKELSYKGRF